jgi:hypothetical protein
MATDTILHSNFSPCASCRAKKCCSSAESAGMRFMNCVCRRRRMVSYLLCTICIGTTPNSLAFQHVVPVSMMLASSKLNAKPNPAWNLLCRMWMTGITSFASSTQLPPSRLGLAKCKNTPQRMLQSSSSASAADVKENTDVEGWLDFLPQECSVLILGEANLSFSLVRRPPPPFASTSRIRHRCCDSASCVPAGSDAHAEGTRPQNHAYGDYVRGRADCPETILRC